MKNFCFICPIEDMGDKWTSKWIILQLFDISLDYFLTNFGWNMRAVHHLVSRICIVIKTNQKLVHVHLLFDITHLIKAFRPTFHCYFFTKILIRLVSLVMSCNKLENFSRWRTSGMYKAVKAFIDKFRSSFRLADLTVSKGTGNPVFNHLYLLYFSCKLWNCVW